MTLFRKKPVVVEATQWFKHGDHLEVRDVDILGEGLCKYCGKQSDQHGWITTLEGGHIVCPGDWIITGVHGEHYQCKPDIFEKTYERVDNEESPSEEMS